MSYKYYFLEELKKRLFLVPVLFIIILVFWMVNGDIEILKVVWSLFLVAFIGISIAAFIKYKNNGKDLFGSD